MDDKERIKVLEEAVKDLQDRLEYVQKWMRRVERHNAQTQRDGPYSGHLDPRSVK